MNNNPHDDLPLSNDPEENLRMQNELLRLKVRAELGAIPQITDSEFLKNMLQFETATRKRNKLKFKSCWANQNLSYRLNDGA